MSDRDVKDNYDRIFDFDHNGKLNSFEQMEKYDSLSDNYHGGGRGGSGGLFGTIVSTILYIVASIVLLSAVLAFLNVDVENMSTGLLMFLYIIALVVVGVVTTVLKK